MHIKRVRIKNIRGFANVDLDLGRPHGSSSGWTVLAGRNGSGKSTLLRAIALSVIGPAAARSVFEGFSGWIRTGKPEAVVETFLEPSHGDILGGARAGIRTYAFWTGLSWKAVRRSSEPSLSPQVGRNMKSRQNAPARGPWAEAQGWGWFLAGYGPTRRLTGHASEAMRLMLGPERIARVVSLFREDASLVESVQWLREIYLRRLERKADFARLEANILDLLNDGLLPGDVRVERIDSEGLWIKQGGVTLPLRELSDGYRTVAALVTDIVRHLYRGFKDLKMQEVIADDEHGEHSARFRIPLPGVVLIDEVETHLHVSWQKRIGFWLKQHFPNIQFIVTTHSPFICQAADARGLINLPAPGEAGKVAHVSDSLFSTVVNGGADDAVISELFGLDTPYSYESEKLREQVAQLESRIQKEPVTKKDQEKLSFLRARLPQSPSADVEQALRKLAADE